MKGLLFPIGGHLQLVPYNPIIRKIKEMLPSKRIAIISAASANPLKTAKNYSFIFNALGINTDIIPLKSRENVDSPEYIKYVKWAGGIFLPGGNQMRLTSLIGGTELHRIILRRLSEENNFLVAGTSAGAAAMPETMIAYGEAEEALLKGSVRLAPGLGFIGDIILDTHLITRNRIWRLLQTVAENPGLIGIGLAENTGLLINGKGKCEVVGEDAVVIVDGSEISYTNIPELEDGKPFTVKDIKVHILTQGDKYILKYALEKEYSPF